LVGEYIGYWFETLDEDGLFSVSVAMMVQLSEPLYFEGLFRLLICIFRGPIKFILMVEVAVLME
jgi:hypothetical protein